LDIPICFHSGGYANLGPGKVVENDDSDDDDDDDEEMMMMMMMLLLMMMMMTLVSPGSGASAKS